MKSVLESIAENWKLEAKLEIVASISLTIKKYMIF